MRNAITVLIILAIAALTAGCSACDPLSIDQRCPYQGGVNPK